LTTLTSNGTPSIDIAGDCAGNWYTYNLFGNQLGLNKYLPNGGYLQGWTSIGSVPAGTGSLAIAGNKLYAMAPGGVLYTGVISSPHVDFTIIPPISGFPLTVTDMASCPIGQVPPSRRDSVYSCAGGPAI